MMKMNIVFYMIFEDMVISRQFYEESFYEMIVVGLKDLPRKIAISFSKKRY